MEDSAKDEQIREYYEALFEIWGQQHWWPAHTRFEVIAGAYLTQNTAWGNVERALDSLRKAGVLSVAGIRRVPLAQLEKLIRSAGYFRQKARRLKIFVAFLDQHYGGSLSRMFRQPTAKLREELLALNGVGRETADSILLYAGQHPVFVVDAYTRRVAERHGISPAGAPYDEIRQRFERSLLDVPWNSGHVGLIPVPGTSHAPSRLSRATRSHPAQVFNEMHALIVGVGKRYCSKSAPKCDGCPLQKFLPVDE